MPVARELVVEASSDKSFLGPAKIGDPQIWGVLIRAEFQGQMKYALSHGSAGMIASTDHNFFIYKCLL
jgi:hypothetical protein